MPNDTISPEFIDAVRDSVRRQAHAAIVRRRITLDALDACPRCHDRIISIDEPLTFAREGAERICRSCRAQTELTAVDHHIDLGGEA